MAGFCGKGPDGVTQSGHLYIGNIAGFVCRCFNEGWPTLAVYGVDATGPIALAGIRNGRMWLSRAAA